MVEKKVGLCRFDRVPPARQEQKHLHTREAFVDRAKYVADDRAQDHQDRDNNNGNQNKNQCILNQPLAFFLRSE